MGAGFPLASCIWPAVTARDRNFLRLSPRRPWILTVGRLEPDRPKGHRKSWEPCRAIADAVPEVQWHVVGQGAALEDFRQQVAASPCSEHIHLHGFLEGDQLQQLFQQCRLFAMPSFGEGFGIVYFEAMQHGCVPVGSTLDAAPEVIGDGGICIDVNDHDTVAAQLTRLLCESDSNISKGHSGRGSEPTSSAAPRFEANLLEAIESALVSS